METRVEVTSPNADRLADTPGDQVAESPQRKNCACLFLRVLLSGSCGCGASCRCGASLDNEVELDDRSALPGRARV